MADEFGQRVSGLHLAGDGVSAEDRHIAVLAKDGEDEYALLTVDEEGALVVSGELDVTLDAETSNVAISDGTNTLAITGDGFITAVVSGTVTVDASELDIRALAATTDNVAISDGTNTLAIQSDGSINVNASLGAEDSEYTYGGVNLVKDTATEVVAVSPSEREGFSGMLVSGAGYCEWDVMFGTTGSETTIMKFWTTPSNPTQFVDLPDYLKVDDGQTLKVMGTNREKAGSPASDFTGHATLVRKA